MDDIHCFEVSEIHRAAYQLSSNPSAFAGSPAVSFLPAPKTWIEHGIGGERCGWLLEHIDAKHVRASIALDQDHSDDRYFGTFGGVMIIDLEARYTDRPEDWTPERLVPAYLLFINSPRVIGRRQHMPHRGLERKLIARRHLVGKFPLHAWTEIKLEVDLRGARDASGEPSHEAHLTGHRALHFCRSHLRIRLGRLEIVTARLASSKAATSSECAHDQAIIRAVRSIACISTSIRCFHRVLPTLCGGDRGSSGQVFMDEKLYELPQRRGRSGDRHDAARRAESNRADRGVAADPT
jgi:hypothetical protein